MAEKFVGIRSDFYAVTPLVVRPENPHRLTAPELRKQQFRRSLKGVFQVSRYIQSFKGAPRLLLKVDRVIKPVPVIVAAVVALFAVAVAAKAVTGI